MIYNIIIKYSNKLVGVGCSEFGKELAVLACYNKLLVVLLGVVLFIGVIIINLKVFIVRDKLLEGSTAWVIIYKIDNILVLIVGSLTFTD
jgi:hypothetical protein